MSIFKTNLYDSVLYRPPGIKFKLTDLQLPTNHDWFFMSKCEEIFEQYNFARMYLEKSREECQEYWFPTQTDIKLNNFCNLTFRANLYETSLIYYNILVDLSWVLTKISLEYYSYIFDKNDGVKEQTLFTEPLSIEKAKELIRRAENETYSPTSSEFYDYLRVQLPTLEYSIDMIKNFWILFKDSPIRNNYNYIKHKGKPIYDEILAIQDINFGNIYIKGIKVPSNIVDIQYKLNLESSIQELIDFDNDELYPYLTTLETVLEKFVNPSQLTRV